MISGKVARISAIVTALVLGWSAQADGKRYLVKFQSPQAFFAASQSVQAFSGLEANSVTGSQAKLFNTSAKVTQTLDGVQLMVIESSDALAIAALRTHPGIALVEEEVFHPAPAPIGTRGGASITNNEILRAKSKGANDVEVPWGITAVKAPQAWAVTKGNTARVLVLDTGVDRDHQALKSRIEAVQNFTNGDPNDVTDLVGHGSHVSGTILADGQNGLVGVAPEARLLMGKVCTDLGCSSVAIATGINWAVQAKVDVVNMSLGGMFMTDAEGQALIAAEAAGVLVIAASGNDGKPRVSFPAASPTAFAVGAIDANLNKADFSNWGPELAIVAPGVDVISSVPRGMGRGATVKMDISGKGLDEIKSLPFVGSPINGTVENELVFAGLGKPTDFASVNVSGKFALIQRGEITFKDKVANALSAGAVGVVIFNNAAGLLQGTLTDDGTESAIPAVMIEQTVGEAAKLALANGSPVRASLAVIRTDFASFQGTSMATPHVAGVAALVRAANKSLTPAQVRDILRATATPLSPNDQNQMGSGLINAEAAVARAQSFLPLMRVAN